MSLKFAVGDLTIHRIIEQETTFLLDDAVNGEVADGKFQAHDFPGLIIARCCP